MELINLRLLSGLLSKKALGYVALLFLIASAFMYQKIKIEKLENKISNTNVKLKDVENELQICKSNSETFISNIKQKDMIIKQLQAEIKNKQQLCQELLKKKDQLIKDLQRIKAVKPKDIKPTVIYKRKCSFKIETGEQLHEKDFIFDTLSNIGK